MTEKIAHSFKIPIWWKTWLVVELVVDIKNVYWRIGKKTTL